MSDCIVSTVISRQAEGLFVIMWNYFFHIVYNMKNILLIAFKGNVLNWRVTKIEQVTSEFRCKETSENISILTVDAHDKILEGIVHILETTVLNMNTDYFLLK